MKCEETAVGGRAKSGVVLFTTNPMPRHPGLRMELNGETPASDRMTHGKAARI